MTQSEKLKGLISSLKTSNEVMKKQMEIQQRTIDLIVDLIIEPESVEPTNIKPEDMVSGKWYFLKDCYGFMFTFSFNKIEGDLIKYYDGYNHHLKLLCDCPFLTHVKQVKILRPANREEVTRFFPHEFEIPTHGGNDVKSIERVTDEQLQITSSGFPNN